jgi:hypothetical protein
LAAGMSSDLFRYDLLTQDALRGVIRTVLAEAATAGMPGDHHFYISFNPNFPGVRLSPRLRAQYPNEMTIVLQHQFWDLAVTDLGFEVGLSFGGVPEKLAVPFAAITGFFDPSVQFGLKFEAQPEATAAKLPADSPVADAPAPLAVVETEVAEEKAEEEAEQAEPAALAGAESGAEIVSLDKFRKK